MWDVAFLSLGSGCTHSRWCGGMTAGGVYMGGGGFAGEPGPAWFARGPGLRASLSEPQFTLGGWGSMSNGVCFFLLSRM